MVEPNLLLPYPADVTPSRQNDPILASGKGIHPFCQAPPRPAEKFRPGPNDLFTLFTSAIIKADIVFVR
jgi:hypothetical protein